MPFLDKKIGKAAHDNGKGKRLTPKMLEFVDLYMIHMNAIRAIELSSYKTRNASNMAADLMRHPLVIEEVNRRLEARSEKATVTAEFILQKLINIVDNTEVTNPSAALRGLELLGKSIALWKERQEISGPDGTAIKHEQTVREDVADFTSRISSLAKRTGTADVIKFPDGRGEG